jgi:hypothetical protein
VIGDWNVTRTAQEPVVRKFGFVLLCCGLGLVSPAFAGDDSHFYSKNDQGETVWTLTDYLHGTTAQVRALLNKDTDRLTTGIEETNHDINELQKEMGPEEKRVVEAVRSSDAYRQLTEQMNQADADRKTSQGLDKLDASSRFNKARLAMQKMEHDAVMQDAALADDEKELATDQRQLAAHKAAMQKAQQWRWQLVSAIRGTFQLAEPLDVGTRGLVPSIKVLALTDDGPVGEFFAEVPGSDTHAKAAEGIESAMVEAARVNLLVLGSYAAKIGRPLPLNQSFEVVKVGDDPKVGPIYVMKPVKTEVDGLLEGMPTEDPSLSTTRPSH